MKAEQTSWPKLMLRLPPDAKAWLKEQSERYGNSKNAEVVRAIREKMERTNKTGLEGAVTPARP